MEIPQVSRRRASSVVTRQFIRNDPLPWNIKVNFEATTVASSKPRSQTLALTHGFLPAASGGGRPRNVSTTSSQPSRITKAQKRVSVSQKWWAVRQDAVQSKVRYIFGPSPDATRSDRSPSFSAAKVKTKNRRASTYTSRTRRIRKRFMLPIVIQGHSGPSKILAFPDTGCDHNIISLEVMKQLGLDMEPVDHDSAPRFSVANGKIVEAIGQLTIKFGFAGVLSAEESSFGLFFVFNQLAVPTIIGRPLLEQTQTFTRHRHRLIEEIVPSLQCLSLTSLAQPRRDLCCRLNGHISYATADTGSDLDLVSPEFAEARGFTIDPAFEKVQFADGSYGVTCGVIPSSNFAVGSQDEASGLFVPRGESIQRDFYVLESLTSEILVGLDTLEKLRVYDTYQDSLVHRMSVLSFSDANVVRYIGSLEYLTREALKKMKSKKTQMPTGEPDSRRDVLFADQRENARREVVKLTIANLTGDAKRAALEEEERRVKAYEEERRRRIEAHVTKDSELLIPASPSASSSAPSSAPSSTSSPTSPSESSSSTSSTTSDRLEGKTKPPPKAKKPDFHCSHENCHFSQDRMSFATAAEKDRHEHIHEASGYVCPFCTRSEETVFSPDPSVGPRLLVQHVMAQHPDLDPNEPYLQHIFHPVLVSNAVGRKFY